MQRYPFSIKQSSKRSRITQQTYQSFILLLAKLLNLIKMPFSAIGTTSAKAHLRNTHNFISVLSLLKCNACPVSKISSGEWKILCSNCGSMGAKILAGEEFYLESIDWNMNKTPLLWMISTLVFILGCDFFSPASNPTPDLFATLQASTPSSLSSPATTHDSNA